MINQEDYATEIMESYYKVIVEGLIGIYPLEVAKTIHTKEFLRAKKCALISVNQILELPIGNVKSRKKWIEIKSKIEQF